MSAQAVAWAYRHSPFRGATLLVHLAAADSVNDQNEFDFWMSQASVADKARVSRQSANAAIEELVEGGFFAIIKERPGFSNLYRFLFPDVPVIYEPRRVSTQATGGVSSQLTGGVKPADKGVSTGATLNLRRNPREPKGATNSKKRNPHCPDCGGKSWECVRCARYGKREAS